MRALCGLKHDGGVKVTLPDAMTSRFNSCLLRRKGLRRTEVRRYQVREAGSRAANEFKGGTGGDDILGA